MVSKFKDIIDDGLGNGGAFEPIRDLITITQVRNVLLAWIPIRFGPHINTGIFTVDMFLTSMLVAVVTSVGSILCSIVGSIYDYRSDNYLTIEVNYYRKSYWGSQCVNPHYTAILWLISKSSGKQKSGNFKMNVTTDYISSTVLKTQIERNPISSDDELLSQLTSNFNSVEIPEDLEHFDFNLLPKEGHEIQVTHEKQSYTVWFEKDKNQTKNSDDSDSETTQDPEPILFIQPVDPPEDLTLADMYDWILKVARLYDRYLQNSDELYRYKYDAETGWTMGNVLHFSRGLDCICLDQAQDAMLRKDLNNFMQDKDFYARMGMPYRRGYLFSGKPGTGKSSLINAISATFKRDLYYINLKDFKDDTSLQCAFSDVKKNGIIVLEDVDAQSRIVHKRSEKVGPDCSSPLEQILFAAMNADSGSTDKTKDDDDKDDDDKKKKDSSKYKDTTSGGLSLSALLNCMDGYTLNEGVMIIMTSNHPERLDPAVIRPGRIDLHLELGYSTHYQIQNMYSLVKNKRANDTVKTDETDNDDAVTVHSDEEDKLNLDDLPEYILPPCDAMRVILLYRTENADFISAKLLERALELQSGKEVGDAMTV
ncbi:hypothetical protein HDV02_001821 [Globomyces sp. JEL0801]|nr:hypothetical protein HDV02_001821 [Globomyces sp. JEL0801]